MKYLCQSCAMPLSRDEKGGGTNEDGSLSAEYCSYCYASGAFVHPEITSGSQMQAYVQSVLQKDGYPKPVAWLMTLQIPKLKRWKRA
jgi:orotate phosphoribosyltransferase-like protein